MLYPVTVLQQSPSVHTLEEPSLSSRASTCVVTASKNDVIAATISQPILGRALTAAQLAALSALSLTEEHYRFFVETLVGHRFDFIRRPIDSDAWYRVRNAPLTNETVLKHLKGLHWIGTGCRYNSEHGRHETTYIAVDLDSGPGLASLVDRYDRVRHALGQPSFVVRSSESGGLHVYYLLADPTELHVLRAPATGTAPVSGLVLDRLRAAGLEERQGAVEVYPRGQYRQRGVQPRLRLPFGSGLWLVDWTTLERDAAEARAVPVLYERYCDGDVRLVSLTEWEGAHGESAPVDGKRTTRTTRPVSAHEVERDAEVVRLLSGGLSAPGTRHEAVTKLAFDFRRRGMDEVTATDAIDAWLRRHHNGHSRTFNKNPARALKETHEAVARVFQRPSSGRVWLSLPPLSRWEVERLLSTLWSRTDPLPLSAHERFKRDELGFFLMRKAKQYVITAGPVHGDSGLTFSPTVWPDVPAARFLVPIPYTLRTSVPGISRRTAKRVWNELRRVGLFELVAKRCTAQHRAETYAVELDFGAYHTAASEFWSLGSALAEYANPQTLAGMYSRHFASKLLRERDAESVNAPRTGVEVCDRVRACIAAGRVTHAA